MSADGPSDATPAQADERAAPHPNMQPVIGDRLIKRGQVQTLLGIGHSKFFELVNQGRLEAVKFDGQTMIRASVLQAFINGLPPARGVADEQAA